VCAKQNAFWTRRRLFFFRESLFFVVADFSFVCMFAFNIVGIGICSSDCYVEKKNNELTNMYFFLYSRGMRDKFHRSESFPGGKKRSFLVFYRSKISIVMFEFISVLMCMSNLIGWLIFSMRFKFESSKYYASVEDDVGSVIDILLGFRLTLKLFWWLWWRFGWLFQISGNA